MSADTQQNILYALYFLILHNYIAIGLALGLGISTIFALVTPTRGRVLLMVGCALLLLAFEYRKHIRDPLLEQTKQSLITERYSSRLERVITLSISRGAPIALNVGGITAVICGLGLEIYPLFKRK